ncbi:hypothetical protein [Xenorhabdus entomophaga]|uniref:hypothetical protein n=1 Tax=Xenorhabdus entomophaga TaxID=3136257 RepID=UPI0030F4629E
MKKLAVLLIGSVLLAGCGPKELSLEEKQQVDNLKVELTQTEKDISIAKLQDEQYAGGLIKSLIEMRLEVLETNKALLQQRINAIESGAEIDIVVNEVKQDPEASNVIKAEIENLKSDIEAAKKDAANYSGGLVQAVKLSTVATQEQTLAMLQQKYLSAKYGLTTGKISNNNQGNLSTSIESSGNKSNKNEIEQQLLPPADGPFGLQAGLTKKNIEDMTGSNLVPIENSVNLYVADKLPKKNTEFKTYALLISPTAGLCQIRAISKNIKTDSYGISLKSKFEDLKISLDSIYGESKKADFLLPDSIWEKPQDWMMGLYKEERFLSAEWESKSETLEKNYLDSIALEARANDRSDGYLFLQYNFENNKKCKEEIDNTKKSSL